MNRMANRSSDTPRLWSDFDGTAVQLARKTDPRNWSKYPLRGVPGYPSFLRGIQDSGVEIAGVVSRRPNIAPRRWATARSVTKLGLREFFGDTPNLVLAGSETAKGRILADESYWGVVGIVEDKPHKVVPLILAALQGMDHLGDNGNHPIVMGVVSHERSLDYTGRLLDDINHGLDNSATINTQTDGSFNVTGSTFSLDVVPLKPFSQRVGQEFGERLLRAADQ